MTSTSNSLSAYTIVSNNGVRDDLLIHRVMRRIEKRRFSGKGRWRGQDVFFKIFVAVDHATRHVDREQLGTKNLTASNIPTAEILHEATIVGEDLPRGSRCLLFRWIDGAENVDQVLHGVISETRALGLLNQVAQTIGNHHNAGLVQKDLHFANFAVVDDCIYTFDTGSIEKKGKPIPKSSAIENIATFFAQIDPVYVNKSTLPLFLGAYVEAGGDKFVLSEQQKLWKKILRERKRRMDRFMEKMLRSCGKVAVYELDTNRRALLDRDADNDDLRALVAEIDFGPEPNDNDEFAIGSQRVQVKTFANGGNSLFGFADIGPARRTWQACQRLRLERVPIVRPLACVEGNGKRKSWLLFLRPTCESLSQTLESGKTDQALIATNVAETLIRLHQLNLTHGRMSRDSFLATDDCVYLCQLEDLKDGEERDIGGSSSTSKDMRECLDAWKGHSFSESLLSALNNHGFAFDL